MRRCLSSVKFEIGLGRAQHLAGISLGFFLEALLGGQYAIAACEEA
jgi:hypothetical protein